jgi:hypothetical protein
MFEPADHSDEKAASHPELAAGRWKNLQGFDTQRRIRII